MSQVGSLTRFRSTNPRWCAHGGVCVLPTGFHCRKTPRQHGGTPSWVTERPTWTSLKCLRAVSCRLWRRTDGGTVAPRKHLDVRSPCGRRGREENCHECAWLKHPTVDVCRSHECGAVLGESPRVQCHSPRTSAMLPRIQRHMLDFPACALDPCAFDARSREHNQSESKLLHLLQTPPFGPS